MPPRPQQFRASTDSNPQRGRGACSCHIGKQRENHMAKTNYQVTFNAKVVGISKRDRIYTLQARPDWHGRVPTAIASGIAGEK
jgi:hypothetical protein